MPEKQEYSQLELFSAENSSTKKGFFGGNSFLGYVRGYEKVILLIICFILTALLAFALGVEKGKKYLTRPALRQALPALKPQVVIPLPGLALKTKEAAIGNGQGPLNTAVLAQKQQGNYTIQLASYQSKNYAQKEADKLKKMGMSPLILTKGKYSILCVGNFNNKEAANTLLSELKIKYQDCRIRRL